MSWTETSLAGLFHIKHGYSFKSEFFGTEGRHIVLTPGNFQEAGGFRLRPEKERYYSQEPPEAFVLGKDDLIVAMTEQGEGLLGSCAFVPADNSYLHNQRIGLIEDLDETRLRKRYLYWLLNTRGVRAQIRASASGTKVRHTSPSRISEVKTRLPSPVEQDRIAEVLFAYDDLIENNRRRIRLLEEAAQLLYREWFVHFRFPGHEHFRMIDGLPEGWQRLSATEAFYINPATSRGEHEAILYVPMAALSTSGSTIDSSTFEKRQASTSVRFRNGDTLFARITPCLENGKTGFVSSLQAEEVACGSTEFIVLRGRRTSNAFAYLTAREESFRQNAVQSMIGASGRQRVQPSCFDRYTVPIAPRAILATFDEITSSMFEQIARLDQANEKLAQARDLLLPRLMTGELAV